MDWEFGIEYSEICDYWMELLQISIFDLTVIMPTLGTNEERFKFVMELYEQNDPKLFTQNIGKTLLKSKGFREAGNKKFATKNYKEANELYTQSLAFAPKHSHEQILALGNRAATSLHLGYIPEALLDVQRALEMPNITEDYKKKMEKRKEACMVRIVESNQPLKLSQVPEIAKKSEFFDCTSDKVILSHSKKNGRFLSANADIRTGELLAVETPYTCIAMPMICYTHCSYCLLSYPALIECEECTTTLYCSNQCLNKDKASHTYVCKILERLVFYHIDPTSLIVIKTLINAALNGTDFQNLQETSNQDSYSSLDFQRVYGIVGHTERRSPGQLFLMSFMASSFVQVLRSFSSFFNDFDISEITAGTLLLHLFQSLNCNAQMILNYKSSADFDQVGPGVYNTHSLISHSCDPNVFRHYVGSTSILRAIRPIKKGDELLGSYAPLYTKHTIEERSTTLMKIFFFNCECRACVFRWPMTSELPSVYPKFLTNDPSVKLMFNALNSAYRENATKALVSNVTNNQNRSVEMLNSFCEYVDFLDSSVQLPLKQFNNCQNLIQNLLERFPCYQR